ncbi:MAG: hypothetical protein IPM03_17025 [Sulfuritalea sp.]|nr:hypothetical protein [Sulfuritalea sp.]
MGNDNRPEIVLDGDVSPFRQKLREAAADLKRFGADGERAIGGLTGPLGAVQAKFVAIGAVLAGGAVFREAVTQTITLTEESTKLARALGISTSEASILREALTAGNTSQEEFVGAAQKLAKQVKDNEDGLQAMGLKTRDAAGQLRPLNELTLDAIGVLNGYRAGTDRAIAGQALFGKGFEMTSNLALLNKQAVGEVAEQMKALGLVASTESVAAWQAYDDASDSAALTLLGFKATIGNALLPVLTTLGNWFAAIGPAAVVVLKGAVGGLISMFWLLKAALIQVSEVLNATVITIAEPIIAIGQAMARALTGDFAGAASRMKEMAVTTETAWRTAFRNMQAEGAAAGAKIWNLFADGTPTAAPGKGGKGAGNLVKDGEKDKKEAADPSHMGTYEAALAERKNLYEQENALRQFSKEQELAYWRELQATYEINSKDQLAIAKRTATLELEIRREMTRQGVALTGIEIEGQRAASQAKIEALEEEAKFAQAQDQITKDQLLAQQQQFLAQRYEIELLAAMQRQELASINGDDPVEMAKLRQQQLEIERNYERELGDIQRQRILESSKNYRDMYASIETGFASVLKNFATGAQTIGQTITGLFRAVGDAVVNMLAAQAASWLLQQLLQLIGVKTTAATTIKAKAAEAGAGGVASMAAAPFPLNLYAPEFGAAMAAVAASYGAAVTASAARGYDIPRGLNPVTQLHEEEMVLPQKYANVIRGLVGVQNGDGGGGGEGGATININAMDARSMRDYFKANAHALGPAMHRMKRNGVNFSN